MRLASGSSTVALAPMESECSVGEECHHRSRGVFPPVLNTADGATALQRYNRELECYRTQRQHYSVNVQRRF